MMPIYFYDRLSHYYSTLAWIVGNEYVIDDFGNSVPISTTSGFSIYLVDIPECNEY